MSSSTSSFDSPPGVVADAGADASWRRWIIVFCATFFGLGGLLFTLLLLIDPYDSARFPTFGIVGIDDHNPRMANVSRGRDPAFDGAVFGNSTGQLIDPHRIGPPHPPEFDAIDGARYRASGATGDDGMVRLPPRQDGRPHSGG